MKRKHAVIAAGVVACLAGLAGTAFWLLTHQPGFYRAALLDEAPPEERQKQARRFVQATGMLVNGIRNDDEWSQEFTDQEVNSWLADELPVQYAHWLPPEVTAPRVKFENGALWLAFQTRRGAWSGVVSGRVKVWVSAPNELALEIQSLSAGLVPVPVDDIVGDFVAAMNANGWRMEWKQSTDGDVLLVSLDDVTTDKSTVRPALETVELLDGKLRVSGRRKAEPSPRTAEMERESFMTEEPRQR